MWHTETYYAVFYKFRITIYQYSYIFQTQFFKNVISVIFLRIKHRQKIQWV